jgi:hypothetical protein
VPPRSTRKINPSPTAPTAASVSGPTGTSSGGTGPCKLTPVPGTIHLFQVNQTDMPVSFKLLLSDTKTEFLSVGVYPLNSTTPLPNQPTPGSLTAIAFQLSLPKGTYNVAVTVGSLPSAQPVEIVEACSGATQVDWIGTPKQRDGGFQLQVN